MTTVQALWYGDPAEAWNAAWPVGNGRLGGMVFGGIARERIALNDENLWAGGFKDRTNPDALAALPDVRRLLFAGRNAEAEAMAERTMLGIPPELESYEPLGDLWLDLPVGDATEYRREVDLECGIVRVSYRQNGVGFVREVFASVPDDVLVVRLTADAPGALSVRASLTRAQNAEASEADNGDLLLTGHCGDDGLGFQARLRRVEESGQAVTFLLTTGITWKGPIRLPLARLDAAAAKPYDALRAAHVADYRSLFGRVTLQLGPADSRPLDARLQALRDGQPSVALFADDFQYLRYVLICASRPGGLPMNLQGIWNEQMKAPWNSDFHPNINLQMGYWAADGANLAECHRPLFDWMENLVPSGERTARAHYGAGGWTLHHASDAWDCTTPVDGIWGIWPMGAAWLARHVWEHFSHTGDHAWFQSQGWPLLRGAARFLLDFLVEAPDGTPVAGRLVTNPSHSPENRFQKADGAISYFTYAAAMDLQIARDLFTNCLRAADFVERDPEFEAELRDALARLAPLQISPRTGRLQEWVEDYDEPEPGHRHLSHLYGLFPSEEITPDSAPALADAARKSLEHRLASDYDATGWSLAWVACLWARLGEGDRALAALTDLLSRRAMPNLFTNAHDVPQVCDAMGTAAAILEMLIQSHGGVLRLLPALPAAWPDGRITGLRARGGLTVDLAWTQGRLTEARLTADRDGEYSVRWPDGRQETVALAAERPLRLTLSGQ